MILPAAPVIRDVRPDDEVVASSSPVVIVFSESMAPASVLDAFELVLVDVTGFPTPPLPSPTALSGDGRVLLLLLGALGPGDYVLRVAEGADPRDLTGQALAVSAGEELAVFQVDTADPAEPSLLAGIPSESIPGTSPAPTTVEIVAVFDRPLVESSVDEDSFDVQVDGADPPFDPPPEPLAVGIGPTALVDRRVWTWSSVDADDVAVSLGTGAGVEVTLSPAGNEIQADGGGELPTTTFEFTTQSIERPLSAAILSEPHDAIGIANLTAGDPEELLVEVQLDGAEPGDELRLLLFGTSTADEEQIVALSREKTLSGTAPITAATWTLAEIDLLSGSSPPEARFADGPVAFAFQLVRGGQTTPVTVLDADPLVPGIQDPVLDTTAPELLSFAHPAEAPGLLRSDVRDLVVAGTASEPVRAAEVTTPKGDNGTLPDVAGSSAGGLFVAAPVPLGIVAEPVDFELVLYDAALNPSAPVAGTFEQRGAVGPGPLVPGEEIEVRAFDAVTLAPLAGALVATHADPGDGSFPLVDTAVTSPTGEATLLTAASGETIVTAELAGHDVVSFHGLAAGRISVPLAPSGLAAASAAGEVETTSPLAALTLPLLDRRLDDSRRPADALALFEGGSCGVGPGGGLQCPFGPVDVRAGRLGAQSFLAGKLDLSFSGFSASQLLQAFALALPGPPLAPGAGESSSIALPFLLTEPGVAEEELPVELPLAGLDVAGADGVDLQDLVSDPGTSGIPFVTVEGIVPGVPGSVAVGIGLGFHQGGTLFALRAARAGAVGPTGSLGSVGAVDPDVFLRAEIVDATGRRAGARPRVSALDTLPVPFVLRPPAAAAVLSPAEGAIVPAGAFEVSFENAIPDAAAQPGLYRVIVADAAGRRWEVWRPDPPDGELPSAAFVDLAPAGGTGLASGTASARVSSFAWPGLDHASFLLSDVEREVDLFSDGGPTGFTIQ